MTTDQGIPSLPRKKIGQGTSCGEEGGEKPSQSRGGDRGTPTRGHARGKNEAPKGVKGLEKKGSEPFSHRKAQLIPGKEGRLLNPIRGEAQKTFSG